METMIAYQEIDKKLKNLEFILANSEERKKASALKHYLSGVEESASKMEQKSEELLVKYEKQRQNFARLSEELKSLEKLSKAKGAEEIKAADKKVSEVLESLKHVESETASLLNEFSETTKAFTDLRKNFSKSKEEFAFFKKKYDDLKLSKNEEIIELDKDMKKAEKKVAKELLAIYNKKKTDKIFPVFVPLASQSYCGGCSTELSLNQKNILNSNKYVECENCRKLVYKID